MLNRKERKEGRKESREGGRGVRVCPVTTRIKGNGIEGEKFLLHKYR